MKCIKLSMLLVAAVVVSACGPQTRADKVAALSGTPAAGKTVYDANCAACHGTNGKGTASGANLVAEVGGPAHSFIGKIIDGIPGTGMSSFAALTDQQIADCYAHIKTLK